VSCSRVVERAKIGFFAGFGGGCKYSGRKAISFEGLGLYIITKAALTFSGKRVLQLG
jgi:hypothetical protein